VEKAKEGEGISCFRSSQGRKEYGYSERAQFIPESVMCMGRIAYRTHHKKTRRPLAFLQGG
jgi:hypothetical protein